MAFIFLPNIFCFLTIKAINPAVWDLSEIACLTDMDIFCQSLSPQFFCFFSLKKKKNLIVLPLQVMTPEQQPSTLSHPVCCPVAHKHKASAETRPFIINAVAACYAAAIRGLPLCWIMR